MFSEILKIIPRLENKDLGSMENTLNGRFARVAKKFGGGLLNAIKGGGVLAIATTLIDKILNPLKEVQESIERTLKTGDDLSTFAKQFNTTAGNLARLQSFGKATGLDPEGVRLLLGKFQESVATAAANPDKTTAVSSFVGRADTAEAFFEFVQSMQKLNPIQQNLVQQEVFGGKQILKASEFLHADFAFLAKSIGGPTSQELTASAERLGALSDFKDILTAKRELDDLQKKARLIGPENIKLINQGDINDQNRENKRLANFDDLKRIAISTEKLTKLLEDGYLKLAPVLSQVLPVVIDKVAEAASVVGKSRAARGMGTPKKDE